MLGAKYGPANSTKSGTLWLAVNDIWFTGRDDKEQAVYATELKLGTNADEIDEYDDLRETARLMRSDPTFNAVFPAGNEKQPYQDLENVIRTRLKSRLTNASEKVIAPVSDLDKLLLAKRDLVRKSNHKKRLDNWKTLIKEEYHNVWYDDNAGAFSVSITVKH
jgi:hypothetical protein